MIRSFKKSAEKFLEGLGSGSPRRGPTVLRLIMARVEERVNESRTSNIALYESETLRDTRNKTFLSSVASGAKAERKNRPRIQEIERFAVEWQDLVPKSSAIRADIIRRLAEDFEFEEAQIPNIIRVLGVDLPEVGEAFTEQAGKAIASIFATKTDVRQRLRWAVSRIAHWTDNLPPFWASFAITITSTLGPIALALPIVFLNFGPGVAALTIMLIGMLNTLTLVYLAESLQRAGLILRGQGFSRMIEHYLGPAASGYLKLCLFAYCVLILFTFTGGFLVAIGDTLGRGEIYFLGGLFASVLWYLSPRNNNNSLIVALSMALFNLLLLLGFTVVLASGLIGGGDLVSVSQINDSTSSGPFILAVGVVMYAFSGHISVSNGANMILKRADAGPAFTKGAAVGMATMTVFYTVWTVVVILAFQYDVIPYSGSVLESLTSHYGFWAVLATLTFVALTLGVGSGNYAMAAFHVVYDVIGTRKSSRHAKRYAQFTGLFVISFTMGLATVAYFTGRFDLSALFGMIGGLMAPIVAGVFPVLIYVSCRARGVAVRSAVGEILSNRFAALMAMSIFLAVFVIQAMSETYYPVWYQMTSLGMAGVVCTLVVHLIRKRRFSPGFVIQIFRSFDGWNPAEWQFYHNGLETELEALWWKTTPNSKMELFTEGTSAARVLSAVELMTPVKLGENIDILIYDKTSHAITTPTHSRVNETMLLIEL